MSDKLEIEFIPSRGGDLHANSLGSVTIRFHEAFEDSNQSVDLVIEAHSGESADSPTGYSWEPYRGRNHFPLREIHVAGVRIPAGFRQVTFSVALHPARTDRSAPHAPNLDEWKGRSPTYELGEDVQTPRRAAVGTVLPLNEGRRNIYDLIAARDPGQHRCDDMQDVFAYVHAGLQTDLGELIHRTYRTHVDEIGEDGQYLNPDPQATETVPLQPWQEWAIQYCTGLYYAQNGRAYECMEAGLGYPAGVACTPNADLYAWARGVRYPEDVPTIPSNNQRDTCFRIRDLANSPPRTEDGNQAPARAGNESEARPRARYEEPPEAPRSGRRHAQDPDGPLSEASFRPGSVLTYAGHVNTVFRVCKSRTDPNHVTYQLFDTGGTVPAAQRAAPPALGEGGWGGAMKEEPWRSGPPSYARTHTAHGHLFVPSRPREASEFPKTMYRTPGHVNAGNRACPLARLCIVERSTSEMLFRSAPFPLTVPFTRLLYSVSNLPASDRFEARWLVDIGRGINKHIGPRHNVAPPASQSKRLVLEFHNTPDGEVRHLRPGYPECHPEPYDRPDLKHRAYLRGDDRHRPRDRVFRFGPPPNYDYPVTEESLESVEDRALRAFFASHPIDRPRA